MQKINENRKEEFIFWYDQKYNDYEIAQIMKLSYTTIWRWRNSMNLLPIRQKRKSISQVIVPTIEQLEILTGTLLGDSSLQYYPQYRQKSPKFKCDHGPKQKEYAQLLYDKLYSLGSTLKRYERVDKRNKKVYINYCVQTKSNPYFLNMYKLLYTNGTKEINVDFLKNFTIKSLAYLYMDDGYADQKTAYICTDSFSIHSQQLLINYIRINFNLTFTIVNHGKYNRLRLSQYDFNKFCNLVRPYIIKSLQYKLKTVS